MKNWLKKLFGKKDESSFFKEVKDGNNVALYDQQTVEYMQSGLPNATQKTLGELLGSAVKLVISKLEVDESKKEKVPITINGATTEIEGSAMVQQTVHEITDPKELQKAREYFEILDETKGHLMCVGEYFFDFIDANGTATQLEYLGYGQIRIAKLFRDDAQLSKPLEFLHWLKVLGISDPLERWTENESRKKESERRLTEWKAAAPKAIIKGMDAANENPFGSFDPGLFEELKSEIPDEKELIMRLFNLYGTGFYEWSGVPIYEIIPGNILMNVNIDFLNELHETETLEREHKEGMARLLAGWNFEQKRKTDLDKVSDQLKETLLAHLEEMGNEGKISLYKSRVIGAV